MPSKFTVLCCVWMQPFDWIRRFECVYWCIGTVGSLYGPAEPIHIATAQSHGVTVTSSLCVRSSNPRGLQGPLHTHPHLSEFHDGMESSVSSVSFFFFLWRFHCKFSFKVFPQMIKNNLEKSHFHRLCVGDIRAVGILSSYCNFLSRWYLHLRCCTDSRNVLLIKCVAVTESLEHRGTLSGCLSGPYLLSTRKFWIEHYEKLILLVFGNIPIMLCGEKQRGWLVSGSPVRGLWLDVLKVRLCVYFRKRDEPIWLIHFY